MRTSIWKSLFKQKGWLEGDRIIKPKDVNVYISFLCGGPDSRELSWVVHNTGDFLVFQPSDKATQYYLWEDICCVSVHKS